MAQGSTEQNKAQPNTSAERQPMLAVAFALSYAQHVEDCSSTDDVCLLQLKPNSDFPLDAEFAENDTLSLFSSEADSGSE